MPRRYFLSFEKSSEPESHSPENDSKKYWVMTSKIKNLGPGITLWAEFEPGNPYKLNDIVIGEFSMGITPMTIVESPRIQSEDLSLQLPTYKVLRKATFEDHSRIVTLRARETNLLLFVRERSTVRNLGMKVVDVTGNLSATEFIIYYTAEGRVDFRELVKDIHGRFRGRHELRQISPREHAGLLGGVGPCGQGLCCSSFISEFKSVTTRQAKEIDPDLSPMKTTGMCGRLKCCLSFDPNDKLSGDWVTVDNDPMGRKNPKEKVFPLSATRRSA